MLAGSDSDTLMGVRISVIFDIFGTSGKKGCQGLGRSRRSEAQSQALARIAENESQVCGPSPSYVERVIVENVTPLLARNRGDMIWSDLCSGAGRPELPNMSPRVLR